MTDYPHVVYNSADMLEVFFEKSDHVVRYLGNNVSVMVDRNDKTKTVGVIIDNVKERMKLDIAHEMQQMRDSNRGN